MQYLEVRELILKPISTFNMGTKYYHMQQYFEVQVVLKLDEYHFKMVTFLKASDCNRQKHNPRRDVDI